MEQVPEEKLLKNLNLTSVLSHRTENSWKTLLNFSGKEIIYIDLGLQQPAGAPRPQPGLSFKAVCSVHTRVELLGDLIIM